MDVMSHVYVFKMKSEFNAKVLIYQLALAKCKEKNKKMLKTRRGNKKQSYSLNLNSYASFPFPSFHTQSHNKLLL